MNDTSEPMLDFARKLESRSALCVEDRAALIGQSYTLRHFEAGRYLVRQGETPAMLGIVVSGYAFRQKLDAEGARQILAIHVPGDILDLQHLHLDVADHNLQTLTNCQIVTLFHKHFLEMLHRRPAINHAIFILALVESSLSREWLLNVGRRDSYGRVAHLLCEMAVRLDKQHLPGGQAYELPMTQEQIADAIGATTVHVNRTLRTLENQGLIARDQRHIRFPDWPTLQQVSGFERGYLHLDHVTPSRHG